MAPASPVLAPAAPVVAVPPAPKPEVSKAIVIAAAGDIAGRYNRQNETAALLLALNERAPLSAILTLGDEQYPRGEYHDFLSFYDRSWGLPALKALTRPVPGNHEYDQGRSNAEGYFDYFNGPGRSSGIAGERGKGYYSFDLGSWHLVALNTSDGCHHVPCSEGSAMLTWLRQDLARDHHHCVLAYWHVPRFQLGEMHGDGPQVAPLWDALYDAGADVVLGGHDHNFQQLARMDKRGAPDPARGIRSFVVGTGGAQPYLGFAPSLHPGVGEVVMAQRYGVLLLDLEPDGYRWRFVAVDRTPTGRVLAEGHDVCH